MDTETEDEKGLFAFEMRCYMPISKTNKPMQTSEEWCIKKKVLDTISNQEEKTQLFVHVCRMLEDRLKTLMLWMVEGSRQPGRPTKVDWWCTGVMRPRCQGRSSDDRDRGKWRRFVDSHYSLKWPRDYRRSRAIYPSVFWGQFKYLIDWFVGWLVDWLIDWLIDWSIDRFID